MSAAKLESITMVSNKDCYEEDGGSACILELKLYNSGKEDNFIWVRVISWVEDNTNLEDMKQHDMLKQFLNKKVKLTLEEISE